MRNVPSGEMPPPGLSWRGLRRGVPAFLKGALRRQSDLLLPNRDIREYGAWLRSRQRQWSILYQEPVAPGLLSIITPVWNGSPARYLKELARSISAQNENGACEWVILDNGCSKPYLLHHLQKLAAYPWVKLIPLPSNIGIVRGLRRCLEEAKGRYVLPVDADDRLHAGALGVIASHLAASGYPPLLYSDEDKIIGTGFSYSRFYQPYMKPDWDPVLLLNSAYIAHLGIADRLKALELGAYSDPETEASPDWDLFVRFMLAGCSVVHIPEVLYSWRVYAQSTAADQAAKPKVHASQRAVLQRFLNDRGQASRFRVELSPLFGGASHFRLARERNGAAAHITLVLDQSDARSYADTLKPLAEELAELDGFIQFVGQDVTVDNPDWFIEALGIIELHPETVMAGGCVRNRNGTIVEAGRYFGFAGACGDPNRGRRVEDPGYFAQMWKQRSVSAVAAQLAVVRSRYLVDALRCMPQDATVAFLGAWLGAYALRIGKRIVYSPFLSGVSDLNWDTLVRPEEMSLFAQINSDIIPDRRFYSCNLSLKNPFALNESSVLH